MSTTLDQRRPTSADPGTPVALGRVLLAGAAVAVWVALAGFAVVAAPVLLAWVGAGAVEPASDVLGLAATGWLSGLGATVTTAESVLTLTPLGLTIITVLLAYRGGGWAVDSVGLSSTARVGALLAAAAGTAGLLAGAVAALVSSTSAQVDPGDAAARSGLLTATGVGVAVLTTSPRWRSRLAASLPSWVVAALRPAGTGLAVLLGAAAALSTLAMVTSFGEIASLTERLDPGLSGMLALLALSLAYLPTIIVWTLAVLVGPGVSIGTGVSISASQVELGALPGFPLLGTVPESVPGWVGPLGAVVLVAAGGLSGVLVARTLPEDGRPWLPAATAAVAGVLLTASVAVLCWGATGAVGPGTLAEAGPDPAAVAGTAGLLVTVSTVLTALGLAWRRPDYRPSRSAKESVSES